MDLFRHLDLLVLLLAIPVFIAVGAPLLGYAVVAIAWAAGLIGKALADRRRAAALAESNRNAAMGVTAAASLGRVWVLAAAILIVGLIEREAGLAAAVLSFAVVTAYFASQFIAHLFDPEGAGR